VECRAVQDVFSLLFDCSPREGGAMHSWPIALVAERGEVLYEILCFDRFDNWMISMNED
jgi:hypothetical protein